MKRLFGLAIALALTATPLLAQKIDIDYAHDFDFESVKTFQYVDTDDTDSSNSLMASRIEDMIKAKLTEGGLTEVQSDPDIYVTNHVTTQQRTSYDTTTYGYGGYRGGYYGWGGSASIGTATTTERTYTDGTLIIDAWDGQENKLVWRGTGTVTVKSKTEKQIRQIESILTKLGNKWKKILKGKGK